MDHPPSSASFPNRAGTGSDTSDHGSLNVVVTGGSSGIGAAIVHAFAARGHKVLYSYFSHPPCPNSLPRGVHANFLDQGDPISIQSFAKSVRGWLGTHGHPSRKLDVLVNNAALGSATVKAYLDSSTSAQIRQLAGAPSLSFSSDSDVHGHSDPKAAASSTVAQDVALMQVNALGPLWVTQSLLPLMTSNANSRSSVIFLGSVGGGTAVFPEYLPADLMSKAAVGYLTRHLAAAHSHSPVDVLCVSPGATRTSMFEASTLNAMGPEEKQRFLASMPKGSLIEPDEVAQCVLAIATSGWARILHGACIDASLGLGVRPGLQTEFPAAVPQPAEVKKSLNPSEGSVPPPPSGPPGAQWHLSKRPAFAPPPSATPVDDPLSVSLHQLAASLRKPRL